MSNQVKRSPIDSINEFLINKKTELLVILDIIFISAFQEESGALFRLQLGILSDLKLFNCFTWIKFLKTV